LLHWLGGTSLGYDAEGTLHSFLITPWGAALLGLPGEMPVEASPPPIVVQPDFTIIAPAGGSLYNRFQLERVTAWQSSGESYVYRITRASLARGLRQGIKIEMILAFLKRVSRGQVPKNVVLALRNWDKRRGQIRLRRALLLQVESEPIMEELSTSPQTRAYLREIISPKAAIISREDWPKLLNELRKLGYEIGNEE
ncbi:MAG: helicase-associated domain-containing protein, partial [Anaerolineales bacterium]|nr:helicase-associated domain-containing protein [Anaerolineales bacterium]